MNTDSSHKPTIIAKTDEDRLSPLFDLECKKINLSVLNEKEFLKEIFGSFENADIAELPTSRLNPYILSADGFEACCEIINSSIAAAAKAFLQGSKVKIAGAVGSSGIQIDPFGEASFTELISAYDEQVKALDEFVDMYIIDNVSSMADMRAALLSCHKTEKPVFVNILAEKNEDPQAHHLALSSLITMQKMGVDAFGATCADDECNAEMFSELLQYAKIPLIADLSIHGGKSVNDFLSLGIDIFKLKGGDTETINGVDLNKIDIKKPELRDDFFVFTHYESIFFLEADTTEISELVECLPDMEETISEACRMPYDILRVEINTFDDAIDFSRNAHMSTLPVMFYSENVTALKMALMLYQGIALIDSSTLIPEDELSEICKKYGAVIY